LVLENTKSGQVDEFGVEALFVGIGQKPNVEFLNGAVQLDDAAFIQVDDVLRTSIPGVFAAGDVRSTPMRQILTAAADGALAAQSCGEYLRTART
jgi:thioredoxin reductase (NADPH)